MKRICTLAAHAAVAGFLLALALVLSSTALAQQVQRPFALPKCLPAALGGTGVGFKTIDGPDGTCHGYWCPDAALASGWRQWQHCRIPGYGWPALAAATDQLAAGKVSSLDDLHAFLLRNQQAPTSAGIPFYNALHAKMDLAMATTKPPPPVAPPPPAWVVDAATAADGTRPAFAFVNGVRATASTARATAGQPCRPEVAQSPSGVAGKVFAAFGPNYSAALVALCRRP